MTALVSTLRKGLLPPKPVDPELIAELVELASGGEVPGPQWRELLSAKRPGDRYVREAAGSLLVLLGRWDGHDDVSAMRIVKPRVLQPEALAEIATTGPILSTQSALDVPLVSIDGPDPLEIDDAVWAGPVGDDIEVVIAIASPGDFFAAGGQLDGAASRRATTFYHPRHTVGMLPEALLDLSSLVTGQPRPALIARLRIDRAGHAQTIAVEHATVRVRKAITYEQADKLITDGRAAHKDTALEQDADVLHWLWEAARRSETRRIGKGAYLLYRVAAEVACPPFAEPTVYPADQATPARRVVGEAMVLYGEAIAGFCRDRSLVVPYRHQDPPKAPPMAPGLYTEAADIYAMIRHMGPARFGTKAQGHATLGIDAYVQATSPLRRFLDLVAQRQVIASLHGLPAPYDAQDIDRAIARNRKATTGYRRVQRAADSYFTLLHVARRGLGVRYTAQVVPDLTRQSRCVGFIPEVALDADLGDHTGAIGSWVQVEVTAVDVADRSLQVRVLGEVQR